MLLFSTDGLPKRDRFDAYREEFVRRFFHWDVANRSQTDCRFAVRAYSFGPVNDVALHGTPSFYSRGLRELRGGTDGFMLVLERSGRVQASQGDRSIDLGAGAATLVDNSRPATVHVRETGRCGAMFVDRAALSPLILQSDDVLGRPIAAANPALRLLTAYLAAVKRTGPVPDPALQRLIGVHIVDLVAAAVGANRGSAEVIASRGVKAGRLAAIRAEIAASLSDPAISSSAVAARVGVSERYLRRLLEETGRTFSQHLIEGRLQLVWRWLNDPRRAHRQISELAYDAGFSDLSYFNRSFRRRFGATPTDVRVEALRRQ